MGRQGLMWFCSLHAALTERLWIAWLLLDFSVMNSPNLKPQRKDYRQKYATMRQNFETIRRLLLAKM